MLLRNCSSDPFEWHFVHVYVAMWNEQCRLVLLCKYSRPIDRRRPSCYLPETRAERSEALESNFEADVGYSHRGLGQKSFRAFDAASYLVPVRSLAVGRLKSTDQVKLRAAGCGSKLREIKRKFAFLIKQAFYPQESMFYCISGYPSEGAHA